MRKRKVIWTTILCCLVQVKPRPAFADIFGYFVRSLHLEVLLLCASWCGGGRSEELFGLAVQRGSAMTSARRSLGACPAADELTEVSVAGNKDDTQRRGTHLQKGDSITWENINVKNDDWCFSESMRFVKMSREVLFECSSFRCSGL